MKLTIKTGEPGSKPKLAISFSGGRTSAVMTKLCLEKYKDSHEVLVTFANTGCEHDNTLQFIKNCDDHFGFGTVWLEAVVNPEKGKGIRHKIVDFDSASRKGEPFEAYIAKYGIPNMISPQCTTRLKEEPMNSFRKEMGWLFGSKLNHQTAIGIRADEVDRMSSKAAEFGFVYPLVNAGYTKEKVLAECKTWPFDLELKGEHYGNCTWCWKKSKRKLMTLALEAPEVFDFPRRMEETYGEVKSESAAARDGRRVFFRKYQSAEDIINDAHKGGFELYRDMVRAEQLLLFDSELDIGSACGESCEIGADH